MFPIRRNVLINSQKGAYSTGHPNVKGEACGHLRFHCHDFNTKTGSAIPADISEMQISELPKWILVIEKYSVYERLVSQGYHKDKPCLLITGRGKKTIFKHFYVADNFQNICKTNRVFRKIGECIF